MNRRQAPIIRAAVPVQTPLFRARQHTIKLSAEKVKKGRNVHQPLQRRELDGLHALPQPRNLLLDPRLRLLDPHLLAIRLLTDPALLQVQVQPDRRLRATDLVAETRVELGYVCGYALVRGARQLRFGRVGVEEFGAEFGKVNLLRVGAAFRVYREKNVIRFLKT